MRKVRIATLTSLTMAGGVCLASPVLCQEVRANWQTQRFASIRLPGHETSAYREMSRGFSGLHTRDDAPTPSFKTNTAVSEIADTVEIKDGHATFFELRPEEMSSTQISGVMDGHGAHLVISLP